jgi:hypothetical protein
MKEKNMYIHLLPQISDKLGFEAELSKIIIPELSVELDNSFFKTGTPYPNKSYSVGSIKKKKDHIGLLIKTKSHIDFFTTIYEFNSKLVKNTIRHVVKNVIVPTDEMFDLVSQDIILNIGMADLPSRVYEDYKNMSPLNIQPTMYLQVDIPSNKENETLKPKRKSDEMTIDKLNNLHCYVYHRTDTIKLHTIESERLRKSYIFPGDRYPHLEDAIEV